MKIVHARTNGKQPILDFSRVDREKVQSAMLSKASSDKKHKKGKRHVKTRDNWTKNDD